MRVTHTYALMEVSDSTFEEIEKNLRDAEYQHMFEEENGRVSGLALQGIMLVRRQSESKPDDAVHDSLVSMGVPAEMLAPQKMPDSGVLCPGFIDPNDRNDLLSQTRGGEPIENTFMEVPAGLIRSSDIPVPEHGDDTNYALAPGDTVTGDGSGKALPELTPDPEVNMDDPHWDNPGADKDGWQ